MAVDDTYEGCWAAAVEAEGEAEGRWRLNEGDTLTSASFASEGLKCWCDSQARRRLGWTRWLLYIGFLSRVVRMVSAFTVSTLLGG